MMETSAITIFAAVLLLAHVLGAIVVIILRRRSNPCRSARRSRALPLLRALDFDVNDAALRTGGAVAPRFQPTFSRKDFQ
ncbi:hypothetical protein Hden_3030 [Hyphomicrobium denitrificans ATCC 51888]|uniref:Uncharacterized protein n=1 Tax=Hyphomicrobium denitrificans (strain ATCC 51888 / DSM 1869 / NCIMB 11706 / TK 0415) TaxID=582899 RepID=D8JVH1_HYPDA|nr:hypothetical protein [Hyphomicrobium denitrificans]ADJ24825.1 hypothetical protein Hden_3030 [Hyphomicrobium denitrificans ATCC 51888]